jgi:hypothetical protein
MILYLHFSLLSFLLPYCINLAQILHFKLNVLILKWLKKHLYFLKKYFGERPPVTLGADPNPPDPPNVPLI